ncbi:MAG: hypothetical protein AAF990_02430 [Bacteroidota bacterium]
MNINELENHLKGLFQGQNDERLDTDEVWNDIKDQLEEDKRRKPFFWLFFGLGILGMAVFSIALWMQRPTDTIKASKATAKMETEATQKVEKSGEKASKELETTSPKQSVRVTQRPGRQTNRSGLSSKRPSGTIPPTPAKTNPTSNIVFTQSAQPLTPSAEDQPLDISYLTTFPQLALRPQRAFGTDLYELPSREKMESGSSKKGKKIEVRRNRWWSSVEGFAGPNFGLRILNSDREPGIASLRKNAERVIPGFSIGSNFQLTNSNGLILYGGVEFQQVNEKLEFSSSREEAITSNGVIGVIVNNQGQVIEQVNGPVSTTQIVNRRKEHYNNYRMLHLSAGIGKRFKGIKLFDLEWTAGVDWNLISTYKGQVQNGRENFLRLGNSSLVSDLFYQRQTGFGIRSGLAFNRFVGDKTSLFIRPDVRIPLKTMTSDTYDVTHKHILFSLKVGGRIYL